MSVCDDCYYAGINQYGEAEGCSEGYQPTREGLCHHWLDTDEGIDGELLEKHMDKD